MTVNNPELFMAGVWDWGFLAPCFAPSRIQVTDIDGLVERNGKLLFLETKKLGATIPMGQSILFRQMVKNGNSVLVIWDYQTEDDHDLLWMTPDGDCPYRKATKETIQGIVRDWYKWADHQGLFVPDGLRPFLDRPLTSDEMGHAFLHIRKSKINVTQRIIGNGYYSLSIGDN